MILRSGKLKMSQRNNPTGSGRNSPLTENTENSESTEALNISTQTENTFDVPLGENNCVEEVKISMGTNTETPRINTNFPDPTKTYVVNREIHEPLICFDPEGGMKLDSWLNYFNYKCSEQNKDDTFKITHIHKYLRGSALTEYINSCLQIQNWSELCANLREKYLDVDLGSFSDFTGVCYTQKDDITQYFHKKIEIGRKLGLNTKMLLEGLTDGLPAQLKQLMTVNPPNDPTEWLKLATKLVKIPSSKQHTETYPKNFQHSHEPQNTKYHTNPRYPTSPRYQNPQSYNPPLEQRQWKPRFQNNSQSWRPNFQNNSQSWRPNLQNNSQNWRPRYQGSQPTDTSKRAERPKGPTQNVHFNNLPPSPCRECAVRGISNAFHWVQTCPFRNPYQSPIQESPTTQLANDSNIETLTQDVPPHV